FAVRLARNRPSSDRDQSGDRSVSATARDVGGLNERAGGGQPDRVSEEFPVVKSSGSYRTLRWRRQAAAYSCRKWSSDSQVFGVPTGKWARPPGGRPIYAIVITLIFRTQVLPRRLNFPSIKERGGSTRSKFVQNVRLFSQLRFKTHNIGSLATTINRGYCGRDT